MPPIFRVCILALLLSLPVTASASAESFLEKLFGFGSSKEEQSQLPPPMPSYRAPIQMPQARAVLRSEAETQPHASGTVRTVCVRTCDGYYFPLSHSTSARNLSADNARCKATCGSDSRLFYSYAKGDPDMAAMIDLTGRRYDALDTAFAYRKVLRPGCTCRPPPWSSSERQRHFKYALEEAQQEMRQLAASDIDLEGKPNAFSQPVRETEDDADDANQIVAASESRHDDSLIAHQVGQARIAPPARRERTAALNQREEGFQPPALRAPNPAQPARESTSNAGAFTGFGLGSLFGFGQPQKHVWPGDAR